MYINIDIKRKHLMDRYCVTRIVARHTGQMTLVPLKM